MSIYYGKWSSKMIIFLALEYINELVGNITSKTGLKK